MSLSSYSSYSVAHAYTSMVELAEPAATLVGLFDGGS
jgi:hypothetical protein